MWTVKLKQADGMALKSKQLPTAALEAAKRSELPASNRYSLKQHGIEASAC
jgi:hypothetical protein